MSVGPDINVLYGWWGTSTYTSTVGLGDISVALNLGPFGGNPLYQVSDFLSIYPKFGQYAQAVQAIAVAEGGAGYAVNDTLTLVQPDASGAVLVVLAVDVNDAVTGIQIAQGGAGYAVASGLTTTTNNAGMGCTVNVTALAPPALITNLPLPVLQLYCNLASASLSSTKWGASWPLAMALYVAHFTTLYLRSEGNPGSTPGQVAVSGLTKGILVSKAAGDVSGSVEVPKGLEEWGAWTETEYGVLLATMANGIGAGMIYAF